jgi:hypothetical protein
MVFRISSLRKGNENKSGGGSIFFDETDSNKVVTGGRAHLPHSRYDDIIVMCISLSIIAMFTLVKELPIGHVTPRRATTMHNTSLICKITLH